MQCFKCFSEWIPAGNKAERLSSVNHTTNTIHHHHQQQQQLTLSWISSRGNFCDRETRLTTQLSIVEYRRDKKLGIYIWRTFSHVAETASCLWTKQTYLGKCSDENLRTSTLVNDGTIRSTTDFASALNNVDNVKISDLLEFLVMLLFFSLYSHPKIICRELQD